MEIKGCCSFILEREKQTECLTEQNEMEMVSLKVAGSVLLQQHLQQSSMFYGRGLWETSHKLGLVYGRPFYF